MRELLSRMRVGSLNNKIQIKTPRTNMEISWSYKELVFSGNSPCKCGKISIFSTEIVLVDFKKSLKSLRLVGRLEESNPSLGWICITFVDNKAGVRWNFNGQTDA